MSGQLQRRLDRIIFFRKTGEFSSFFVLIVFTVFIVVKDPLNIADIRQWIADDVAFNQKRILTREKQHLGRTRDFRLKLNVEVVVGTRWLREAGVPIGMVDETLETLAVIEVFGRVGNRGTQRRGERRGR